MEWRRLLCRERLGAPHYADRPERSMFQQDHDRIVFSAPFRRLANKTQVQPLYEHDHVHHRLIHSIEVSSVGRSLAMRIGHWLEETGKIAAGEANDLAHIVQAACVAHDIGNPPFGHSGEAAIGDWFRERFATARGVLADIGEARRLEFMNFEGNAQGFRIVSRLEMYRNDGGMRLSKATLGAFTKYPTTAATREAVAGDGPPPYIGLGKFGFFLSELELFRDVAASLGLPRHDHRAGTWWARHPLAFVVEAADDICYNIVDLEDAFTTGELPFDIVRSLLTEAAGNPNRETSQLNEAEHIAMLRAMSIGKAIDSCITAFESNYDAIMDGSFSAPLIASGPMAQVFAQIRTISRDRVFTARRKTELEIAGRRVIGNVMSGVLPVFEDLRAKGWDREKLSEHNIQLVRALDLDLREVTDSGAALHVLADFTSGMTDRYAVRIARMLTGI